MADDNKVLEKLGELSGLMKATRDDVKEVSENQKEQGSSIQILSTSIQLIQSGLQNMDHQYKREFGQVNEKLGRDYERINCLEKDKIVADGVDAYKGKKRESWQWIVGIVGALIGILIGVNQLIGISQKINATGLKTTPTAYAMPLVKDSLLDTTNFVMKIDTIRGEK